jgi:hypothetical protein
VTEFPERWTEAALGHKVGSETEVAYRRGDYLAHRAKLMDAWARYCESETANNIIPLAVPLVA